MRNLRPGSDQGTRRASLRRFAGGPCGLFGAALFLGGAMGVAPALAGAAEASAPAVQAFTNAVLIDGTGSPAVEHATVVVRGTNIESAGPAASVSVPRGARVTDLKGKVLMPGLTDMHVHLMGGWDGQAVDMLGYQRYMNALLYAGVTTVLDTGNVQPYIVQLRAEVAAGSDPEPPTDFGGRRRHGAGPPRPPPPHPGVPVVHGAPAGRAAH